MRRDVKTPTAEEETASCGCAEHDGMSRRGFLRALGLTGAAAAGGSMLSARAAYAATPTWGGPILLVLSLRGGFDGLSAVAPLGDPNYALKRPTLAIPAASALATGDRMFGLHPALAPLLPMWNAGKMAAVHAVGTPDQTRSHFSATAELERAAPNSSLRTGWLDRVLAAAGTGTVFEAVQLGADSPAGLLAGDAPAVAADSLKRFALAGAGWVGPRMANTLWNIYNGTSFATTASALSTLAALDTTAAVVSGNTGPQNGAVYPTNSHLGAALSDAAALIRANVGLQALSIDIGDWDMHYDLGTITAGRMFTKLTDLAGALAAFATDLGPLWDRVTVMTISEFGRRVQENGSGGVDHGHGNAMLLLGGGLNGGSVHGTWPTLADAALDDGDLAGTTDYRNVLAEYLTRRMGMSADAMSSVFPGFAVSPVGAFA